MIYPKDEPFREFKRARNPSWYEEYVTGDVFADIHRDLEQVNAVIRRVFPDTPLGVIYSGYHLDSRFLSVPESYDWVGFDCYESLHRACGGRSFVELYTRLLDRMTPAQRLIAVPETWVDLEKMERPDWPEVLTRRLRHHYELALSEPRFIAFVPFIWSADSDAPAQGFGLDRFPELFDGQTQTAGTDFMVEVLALGQEVKDGEQRYPNLAWAETEEHPARPGPGLMAGIGTVHREGWIEAWAVDTALPHKNLRARMTVRDARGRVLHKSRVRRAQDPAPDAARQAVPRLPRLGLHGYRFELSKPVLREVLRGATSVELVVYPGGPLRRSGAATVVAGAGQLRPAALSRTPVSSLPVD
jgi:hypothetical protein